MESSMNQRFADASNDNKIDNNHRDRDLDRVSFQGVKPLKKTTRATSEGSTETTLSTASHSSNASLTILKAAAAGGGGGGGSDGGNHQDVIWDRLRGKLLGRDIEQRTLFDSFERCCRSENHTQEIVLVTGAAGTGKTFLAKSLEEHAIVLSGKCSQQTQTQPFLPFVDAFSKFFRKRLRVNRTRRRVLQALENVSIKSDKTALLNVLPVLKRFMSNDPNAQSEEASTIKFQALYDQTPTGGWAQVQSESPTTSLFVQFIKEFCSIQQPMVLLIDDWQWIDIASLQLVRALALHDEIEGFMLLGTVRGNEVDPQSSLSKMLRSIEDQNVKLTDIRLTSFDMEGVVRCASTLCQGADDALIQRLANFAFTRTKGNPFLVAELLRTLIDLEVLKHKDDTWCLNENFEMDADPRLGSLQMLDVTIQQLGEQSPEIRQFLQIATCLGSDFELVSVQLVADFSYEQAVNLLNILSQRAILITWTDGSRERIRFSHDRWLEASMSLINDPESYRFWVGRCLASRLSQDSLMQDNSSVVARLLFEKAHTLLFENRAECDHVIEILGLAGIKAAQCSAFDVASSYFHKCISLLPNNCWSSPCYTVSLQLYNYAAEMENCLGHAHAVDGLTSEVLKNAITLQDKLRAYDTKMLSFCSRGMFAECVKLGFEVLALLGEPLPKHYGGIYLIRDLYLLTTIVRKVDEEDIFKLSPMTNWKKLAAVKVLHFMGPALLRYNPTMYIYNNLKGIQLTLKHGLCPLAALNFSGLSIVLANPLCRFKDAARMERIGYRMYEHFQAKDLMCRMHGVLRWSFLMPWKIPIRECIPKMMDGARAGMMSGDTEMAGINYTFALMAKAMSGQPLRVVLKETEKILRQFTDLGQESMTLYFILCVQYIQNLVGMANNADVLGEKEMTRLNMIKEKSLKTYQSYYVHVLCYQSFLAILQGNVSRAVAKTREIDSCDSSGYDGFSTQNIFFLQGISEAMMARDRSSNLSNRYPRRRAKMALKKLKSVAKYSADNGFKNKILLIEAELKALKGLKEDASLKWLASIKEADRCGLIHEQAFAHERYAQCLLSWGKLNEAEKSIREARRLYTKWGCQMKSKELGNVLLDGSSIHSIAFSM